MEHPLYIYLLPVYLVAVITPSMAFTILLIDHQSPYRWNHQYRHHGRGNDDHREDRSRHWPRRQWETLGMTKTDNDEINDDIRHNMIPSNSTTATNRDTHTTTQEDQTFDWDTFLDTPFFDPNSILNDPNSPSLIKRFATWVQEDYETVEVIWTATIFLVLIVATQELLRIQIYGWDNYVPFTKGILPGNLF